MRSGRQKLNKKRKSGSIPQAQIPDEKKTRFSFENIDLEGADFHPSHCDKAFWIELAKTLRSYESMALDSFLESDHQTARHEILFERTNMPAGFPGVDPEQLLPYQFGVGDRSSGWRVHGYISNGRFHIVWLDPMHKLTQQKSGRE